MDMPRLADFRRIVVNIGSSLLVDARAGRLNEKWLAALCADIAALHADGRDLLVVSSGAIALGRSVLKLAAGALALEDSQAAAAVGQIALARTWTGALSRHGITAGQILVTLGDTEERRRYLNQAVQDDRVALPQGVALRVRHRQGERVGDLEGTRQKTSGKNGVQ